MEYICVKIFLNKNNYKNVNYDVFFVFRKILQETNLIAIY